MMGSLFSSSLPSPSPPPTTLSHLFLLLHNLIMYWYLTGAVRTSSTRLLPYPHIPPTCTTAAHTHLHYPPEDTKASGNPHEHQHLGPEF